MRLEAVNYALGQWEALNVFCSDGAVPLDNNVSEREMKRVVLNRKNSLFVGNARGGRTAAILASLTSTCRRHNVDPQLYLTQLLMNLPAARINELSVWLPDQWKQLHAAQLDAKESMSLGLSARVMMATTRHPEAGHQKPHFHPIEKVGESKFKGF